MAVSYRIDYNIHNNGIVTTYTLNEPIVWKSPRTGKTLTAPAGEAGRSDGATGGFDVSSRGWWLHDRACVTGCWDDGTKMSNWECSQILRDVMVEESPVGFWDRVKSERWRQSQYWFWSTWLMGGGEARKNGMFSVAAE